MKGVAYRLIYTVEADVVLIIAIGPHDEAYARATRR
jgi:mRNA-degrading endonuclease RelE of RelBE toxin-antitoxin system